MNKVIATITKELLLLARDRAGLLLLFLMPLLLIVIMALLQDAPFKDYQELRFDVLVVDTDKGDLARKIKGDIGKSKQYRVIDSLNGRLLTWPVASALVQDGTYKTAILIPEKATATLKKKSAKSANDLVKEMGLQPTEPSSVLNSAPDSSSIVLYFDPAAKRTFKNAIYYSLQRIITQSEMQMMLDYMISDSDSVTRHFDISKLQAINIVEQSTNAQLEQGLVSNSVQHNVPAWAIFAIFFIIIPVAGQIISERQEGTLQRLKLIPGHYIWIQLGKILSYMLVNIVQFYTMLLAGKTIMPFIGLPTLEVGSHPFALFTMVCCISFAASSFALFTGTVFKTVNQALPFGATTIVILSALGGIWIPTEAMPPLLQQIANLSPLHWALEGINDLLLRGMGIVQILPMASMLLFFGVTMLIFSYFYERNTNNS